MVLILLHFLETACHGEDRNREKIARFLFFSITDILKSLHFLCALNLVFNHDTSTSTGVTVGRLNCAY